MLQKFSSLMNRSKPLSYYAFSQVFESHTKELSDDFYLSRYTDTLKEFYKMEYQDRIKGFATIEGTQTYSQMKSQEEVHPDNFRVHLNTNLKVSSIGIGSYLGKPDNIDDTKLFGAIIDSVQSGGINHIDTAINYRYMKSERTIGAAIRYLIQTKSISRDQIMVASKNGYIPADGDRSITEDHLIQTLLSKGDIKSDDVVGNCHCMHPKFLEDQLEKTLSHLGLETLDILYLHNAVESQLPLIGKDKFFDRLAKAFEFYEQQVQLSKIKSYGMASWVCFRAKQEEEGLHLQLQKVLELAKQVGGVNHHYNYTQVPINLMMPETFAEKWQNITNKEDKEERVSFLTAASNYGIQQTDQGLLKTNVISSSPLMNGALIQIPLSTEKFFCRNLGAKHLQFIRSIPSDALVTTLIGQKSNRHTKMNLEVVKHRQLTPVEFWNSMAPTKRTPQPEDELEIE